MWAGWPIAPWGKFGSQLKNIIIFHKNIRISVTVLGLLFIEQLFTEVTPCNMLIQHTYFGGFQASLSLLVHAPALTWQGLTCSRFSYP